MTTDPLGLTRCAVCTNAYAHDAALAGDDGTFICQSCAADYLNSRAVPPDTEQALRQQAADLRATLRG